MSEHAFHVLFLPSYCSRKEFLVPSLKISFREELDLCRTLTFYICRFSFSKKFLVFLMILTKGFSGICLCLLFLSLFNTVWWIWLSRGELLAWPFAVYPSWIHPRKDWNIQVIWDYELWRTFEIMESFVPCCVNLAVCMCRRIYIYLYSYIYIYICGSFGIMCA